jgi:ATP:cob(I)alamin adenosyltransferase
MAGKIYTRGGDRGETSLLGGARVPKDALRVDVYGTLDEGTSMLGMVRAISAYDDIVDDIIALQGELIPLMSEVATGPSAADRSKFPVAVPEQVERMEAMIDRYDREWIKTGHFVRPGGSHASAALDCARAIFRRAERRLLTLLREEEVNPVILQYLNRLSDLLYVMARIEEQRAIVDIIKAQLPAFDGNGQHDSHQPVTLKGEIEMALNLNDCDRMIGAGIRRANEIGVPMVLSVVDPSGDVIETRRMDDALKVSIELAPHKAFTAAALRMPTHELAALSQPGEPLFGIDINMPRLTLVGGGYPLKQNGELVGAVGVSGGSVGQDQDVALVMVAAL